MADAQKSEAKRHDRLIGLSFREAVDVPWGVLASVSTLSMGSDCVDRVFPGRVSPDGIVATAGNERADVMVFTRKRHVEGAEVVQQGATSLSNVKAYKFGK
jgi:hypothetical protein